MPPYGEVRRVGALTWQVIGPVADRVGRGHPEEGTGANNASLVLLVRGARACGCCWPATWSRRRSSALARSLPGLRADVLKVPHHGSRYQDPDLLASLQRPARRGLGRRDNDYGHPAAVTLALLRRAGMRVERTDQDGDVAVTVSDGRLGVRTRGGR